MMPLALAHPRSDEEIVGQTNDLARIALRYIGTGYEVPDDHKFYDSEDPRSHKAWEFACEVQEELFATDPNDALANLPEPEPEPRYAVVPYQRDQGDTYVVIDTLRKGTVIARSIGNSPEAINDLLGIAVTMNAAEEEGA
ncbi:MAG: hypothetical protein J0I99_00500 [Devosia sp.]|uniref:hypothetical protein n=1 Tax=Devosia sp. TaxID=1871048 RepID=UPI001AC72BFA|nr:hypothetical protein [Devosia sp.]MBN9310843.1 hypothetical protein [Devosia sp.]MBN9314196.1 hypothetical protein [Devosia sp.]